MLRIVILTTLLVLNTMTFAAESMRVNLVRVVDGDTLIVNIGAWPDIVGRKIGVRVAGCDTPELRDKRPHMRKMAYLAKDTARKLLENARVIKLRNISRGKYFRLVADVYVDGTNLSQTLISAGLALPYDGGKKPW